MYHAQLGRFGSRDPLVTRRGSSPYEYVHSASIGAMDPSGLRPVLNGPYSPLVPPPPSWPNSLDQSYLSGEIQMIWGYGYSFVKCTDLAGKCKIMIFKKECLGLGLGIGAGGGIHNLDPHRCYPEFYSGWFREYAGTVGIINVGGDIGTKRPSPIPFCGGHTGTVEYGGGIGYGLELKLTMCYYTHIDTQSCDPPPPPPPAPRLESPHDWLYRECRQRCMQQLADEYEIYGPPSSVEEANQKSRRVYTRVHAVRNAGDVMTVFLRGGKV